MYYIINLYICPSLSMEPTVCISNSFNFVKVGSTVYEIILTLFSLPNIKEKKWSGYARLTSMQYSSSQKYILHSADRASITPQPTKCSRTPDALFRIILIQFLCPSK